MSNPLQKIFNSDSPKCVNTIRFSDKSAQLKFSELVKKVQECGGKFKVEGVSRVDYFVKTGDCYYKMDSCDNIVYGVIGPYREKCPPYKIQTDFGEYTFNFETYRVKDSIVLETDKNIEVLYVKLIFHSNKKVDLNFKLKTSRAKNVETLICALNATWHLIGELISDDSEEVQAQKNLIQNCESYWKIVREIEQYVGIGFNPCNIPDDSIQAEKDALSVYKIYFLLIKKRMLKIQSINKFTITLSKKDGEGLKIGQKFACSYVDCKRVVVYGEEISFYTQNFIPKSVISKKQKNDDGTLKIGITGTDTEPMSLIYRGYNAKEKIDTIPDFNKINFKSAKSFQDLMDEYNLSI